MKQNQYQNKTINRINLMHIQRASSTIEACRLTRQQQQRDLSPEGQPWALVQWSVAWLI